ncbi:hypothetical protein DEO72_LG4g525 [Vigna unguiculata]|uniref:Uncharacterized protein n=1 Tax=Vigna unguiculata TaxID=3917 RepID=A0A4D6LLC8_VIGUN|nr:hypothetical protein DEO72_LG4g525 [Vigna unguiculata]
MSIIHVDGSKIREPSTIHLLCVNENWFLLYTIVALSRDCALRRPPSSIAPLSIKLTSSVLLRHRIAREKHPDSTTVVPSIAPLRHRPPQPPLCSDERCHCSVPLLR